MEWQNKRKPTDRLLEPKLLERLDDGDLFQRMQEVESNLDALVQRKRLDLQDMIGRSMRKNETLRIFISSQVFNQAWQQGSVLGQDPSQPNWTLRIEGKLVHDFREKGKAFSSMITSVIVEMRKLDDKKMQDSNEQDKRDGSEETRPKADQDAADDDEMEVDESSQPGTQDGSSTGKSTSDAQQASEDDSVEVVEWHESSVPPEQRVEFDGLDVRRDGNEKLEATVLIQLKEYPDKFKLSPELAAILGVEEESKPGAVVSLWQYIRYHNLQDVDEKRLIKCDAALLKLFKREKIMLPQLVELLVPHLSPREPIKLTYVIDPTQPLANRDIAFDVAIQADHPLRGELLGMLNMWHNDHSLIAKLEDLLLEDVQSLNLMEYQRQFYEQFADDPIGFFEKWTSSQARDLKVIYCDRQFSEEEVRKSSFYTDDLLNSSLHLFTDKH